MMETKMEGVQGDSSTVNPSSVKSDTSSPQHESGRGSPPPNCAICLGTCRNNSFTNSCLHQFCFKCLLTWSKVKAECPLCKQSFTAIIHNVKSNHQYEQYMVGQQDSTERIDIDNFTSNRRFRYRTTLTLPRRETLAIQQLLLHYPLVADVLPPPRRHRSPASFRRTVYRHNLWARPLPDFTGRYRDCTPEFYRYNDSQMHRLVPWLNRELYYLLHENAGHISYVMSRILELLPQYHITSPEFREVMQRYFGIRTDHFLHELYCFASTPYDMTGYDRNVQYTTDSRISTMVNEVISSSDSEASVDSDIVMVSSSAPAEPPAGPSEPQTSQPTDGVIPIETISQSDTDDDSSEVMVVGYIKPPGQRTPEVVDLVGSDSDVVVQEEAQTEPPRNDILMENPRNDILMENRPNDILMENRRNDILMENRRNDILMENRRNDILMENRRNGILMENRPLVKFTFKRQRPCEKKNSESEDSTYSPPACRRLRPRSRELSVSGNTRGFSMPSTNSDAVSTNLPLTPPALPVTSIPWSLPSSSASSLPSSSVSSFPSSTASIMISSATSSMPSSSTSPSYTSDSDSSYTEDRRKRVVRRKSKSKRSKDSKLKSNRKKSAVKSKRTRRQDTKETAVHQIESDRKSKQKSHSGKGVKSSKKIDESTQERQVDRTDPNMTGKSERPRFGRERKDSTRETKRLKSVVKVTPSYRSAFEPSSSTSTINSRSSTELTGSDDKRKHVESSPKYSFSGELSNNSDPEDDIPLNLTMKKPCPLV